jgi:hypothetical protein
MRMVFLLIGLGMLVSLILLTPSKFTGSEANEPVHYSWGIYAQFVPLNSGLKPFFCLRQYRMADAHLDFWGIIPLHSPIRFLLIVLYLVPIAACVWWIEKRNILGESN